MTIKERIAYAETLVEDIRMDVEEQIKYVEMLLEAMRRKSPNDIASVRCWAGYLDALRGVQNEIQKHSSKG